MSNRFHNKFHSRNHHTNPTDRNLNPDEAYDPIASRESPFQGEFFAADDITTAGSLSAQYQVAALDGLFHRNVTIKGNLDVLGDVTQLDTFVYATSAVSITNQGTSPALTVTQTGTQAIAHFIDAEGDDIILDNSGFLGLGTANPNKKLTVLGDISATAHRDDPFTYGYGHIFNDGNTTTKGRLTVHNQTHLLSSAFVTSNLTVNTRSLFVSAGGAGLGKVGINTEVPSKELYVDGEGQFTNNLTLGIDLSVARDTRLDRHLYVNKTGLVALSTNTGISRIGVNTSTPNVELTIKGSLSSTGNIVTNGGLTADNNFYTKSNSKVDGQTTIGTINPTTNPDTSVKVLVHDSDSVVRFNYPNDVIWDTTAEFLTAKNLTVNTLPLYKSRFTLENSPISLENNTINIAANLSANGNFNNTGTIKSNGNLTAANVFGTVIYSEDSNSREWKSVFTTMRNTSATWEAAAEQAGSGGAFNTIKAVSGTWDSTYTIVKANSATWDALADGVVLKTGSDMTGSLTINPQGDNYSSTALSLTGDINLKGTIIIDTNAVAPVMSLSNPEAYGRLEVGGLSGGYIDFKSPFTDDFDIRVAHDQGTSYIATSGDLYLKTGNSLSALQDRAVFKSDGKVGIRTSNPTAYLHVSGSTSVIDVATPIAILGGVEITTTNAGTSYSGGTRADVALELGKVRNTENVGMAMLNFWSQKGIVDASIQRRPVISGGFTTGDATNGDFRITNFGSGVLYIDAGAGLDSGTMQLWAGQGSTLNPGINGARTGVILSEGFIGFRNEFVTVKGVSGSQVRLTNNNDPTATTPISSSISFRNGIDIPDAEILDERRRDGSSSLLFRTTTAGLSTTNRTTTVMAVANGRVGVNTTNPQSILDVNGSVRVPVGDPSSSSQTTIGYAFAGAGNTGLFGGVAQASIYTAGRQAILSQVTSGNLSISLGASEAVLQNDTSGNVFIGTSQYGQGEAKTNSFLYFTKRVLAIRSSAGAVAGGGGGGLLELADGIGGHSIVYRNSIGGSINNGGDLILDGRTANTGVKINATGTGVFQLRTGVGYNLSSEGSSAGLLKLDIESNKFEINDERIKFKGVGTQIQPSAASSPFGTYAGIEIRSEATSTNAPAGSHIDFTKTSSGTKVNTIRSVYSTTGTPSACLIFETSNGNNGNWKSMMAISSSGVNINTNSIYNQGYSLDVGGTIRATTLVVSTLSAANIAATATVTPDYLKVQNVATNETKIDLFNLNASPTNSINLYDAINVNPKFRIAQNGTTTNFRANDRLNIFTGNSAITSLTPGFTMTGNQPSVRVGINTAAPGTTLHVEGGLTLAPETITSENFGAANVDAVNLSGVYIQFSPGVTNNDWAYLRQIGTNNNYHLALDLHDDVVSSVGAGQAFSIRNIGSANGVNPDEVTTLLTVNTSNGSVRCGINTANPTDTFEVVGNTRLQGNLQINSSGTNYGTLFVGRQDNSMEGGQISLAEPNNNTAYWFMDVYDATNPRFRIFTPVGPNPGEALNITNDRRIGIQRMPDAGIILDASGVIRGTQVIANNSGGQVITGFDSTFASTEMVGPRGAYIDLRQQGGTPNAIADFDFSLRLRAFDNINEIEAPYRNLLIRSNSSGGTNESRITLGSGNKVGIGPAITTPAATLHIGGDVIVASGGIRNNNAAADLELYSGTTASKRAVLSLNGTGNINPEGITFSSIGNNVLSINSAGRTVLGSSAAASALSRLHINASGQASEFNNHIFIDGTNTSNGTNGWFIDTYDYTSGVVPFRITARRNGANTNHFVITNVEGNVGIGPSFTSLVPSARIHIRGGTSDGIKMSNNTRGVIFRNDDSDFYLLHTAANDPNGSWNSNRPFSFNFATGLVGLAYGGSAQCIVGSNAPLNSRTYKFQVSGDIYATDWIRTGGNNGWINETHGGGWYMEDSTYVRTYNSRSVYANAFFATGPITTTYGDVTILNISGDSRLEIGASGNAYIDLKKPTGDDFDFRIAHNGNGDNQLLAKGDLNIWTAPADTGSFVHRLQISRNGEIAAIGSEGVIGNSNSGTGTRFEVRSSTAPLLSANSAAYMVFHRPGSYAVKFGLDTNNQLKVGGWSMGNTAYSIFHSGMTEIALPTTLTTTSYSIGSNSANKELVIQNKTTSEANVNVFVWNSSTSSNEVRILTTEMVGDITVGATLLGSKITSINWDESTSSNKQVYKVILAANANQTIAAVGNRGTSVPLTPANAAYITFANQDSNQNSYIAKFGLDTDNKLKVGMGPQYNLSAFDVSLQGKSTRHQNVFAEGEIIGNALVNVSRFNHRNVPPYNASWTETFSKKIVVFIDVTTDIANTYEDINLFDLLPEIAVKGSANNSPQYLKITIMGLVQRDDNDNLGVSGVYSLKWGAYSYYEGIIRKIENSSSYHSCTLNDDTNGLSMGWTRYSSGIPSTTAPSVLITPATSTADGYFGLRLYHTNISDTARYFYYTHYAVELELINI